MADNITAPIVAGTRLATDDIGGTHYPITKMATGVDGTATLVSPTNPMPSTQRSLAFTQTNVMLAAGHIAGTTAIIAANTGRTALKFRAENDFEVAPTASQTVGMRIYATARDELLGNNCPSTALYLATGSSFAVGNVITIWEA